MVSRTACCASPHSSPVTATTRSSSPPSRREPQGTRKPPTPAPWCGCPRSPCPATRASGSGCPAAGSGPRSSGTGPSWCTWPARSSWGRTAPPWPGGSACPRSRCTRPTCRPTPGPTGSAGPARRSPGGGCAASTTAPRARWPRPRSPRPACSATASRTSGCGVAALTRGASTRPSAVRRSALDGVRLVIVGAGPAEAALRQRLPGAVFLGERRGEELAAIYASLDVFVHSGPYETFGQTLQEAAASGLPVVAPAAGGPLDLVEDGVTGYLVPPSDPGAFTAAVARLAADPAMRAAFGAAGRRKVLGRTWPALI